MRNYVGWMLAVTLLLFVGLDVYSKPAGKRVIITYWGVNITPDRERVIRENVIQPFEMKNPDIKVEFLGLPGNAKDYGQKLAMALAAGTPPDIGHIIGDSGYIQRGDVVPLDLYFEKSLLKSKYRENVLNNIRALDIKKHRLFALPISVGPSWIFWGRNDWFKESKIEFPETWDEVFTAAQKFTDKEHGKYGLSIRGGSGSAMFIEYLMYSYSGITRYFTDSGQCTINDPIHVEFVNHYLGLYKIATPEDDITKNWVEQTATFQMGKAAMIFHNLGSAAAHEKVFRGDFSKFRAGFIRSKKGYINLPAPNPSGLVLFKSSPNKASAWKFMEFMASKKQASAWAKILGEIPLNQDCANESWLQEKPFMKTGVAVFNAPATKFYAAPFYLPEYMSIRTTIVEPNVQAVMLKKMTAREMLNDWAVKMEQAKAEFDTNLH